MFNKRSNVLRRLMLLFSILSLLFLLWPFIAYSQEPCPTGQTLCGTACVNLVTDSRNCGRCGTACPTVANGAAVCIQGLCGFNCSLGWANCDQNRANGCETNVSADSRNCGACGRVCVAGLVCKNETCVGASATGTRINLQVEHKSCGRCGADCAAGQTCIYVNGACVLSCQ